MSNSSADEATRGVIVLGDRLALRRIVANIVDNAIKYGRVARLRLQLENPAIVLTVDDEGPGIPADRRQAMLEPFNRLETSRNRATGGAGLGLAVARSLVEAHDGTIGSDWRRRAAARACASDCRCSVPAPDMGYERVAQSFRNTIDAIHPVISAMKAVISP